MHSGAGKDMNVDLVRRPSAASLRLLLVLLPLAVVTVVVSQTLDARTAKELVLLALSTLVSEDAACIAAGHFVVQGRFSAPAAVLACVVGIVVGDLALYAVGRVFRSRIDGSAWLVNRLKRFGWDKLDTTRDKLPGLLVAARFTPGMRLPLYLLAGMTRLPVARFTLLVSLGAIVWVPAVVLASAWLGDKLSDFIRTYSPGGVGSIVLSTLFLLVVLRVTLWLASRKRALPAVTERVARWEFWPMWVFYFPVAVYALLRLVRYRSISRLTEVTRVNPCMPLGGLVGESKSDILRLIPAQVVLPFQTIDPGPAQQRLDVVLHFLTHSKIDWPVILKPDVGQRGEGVRRVDSVDEARDYLNRHEHKLVVQAFHAGPYEVGIFYHRLPGQIVGEIFSITDKVFPVLTGDGVATLRQLIERHPRFKRQRDVFFTTLASRLEDVPAMGELVKLSDTGNHCRGTMFRDGAPLHTPELARAINDIAVQIPGFYFGRFDIRYKDPQSRAAGTDLSIIELNGLTSEATHIYDPDGSPWIAWKTLLKQWRIAYRIGHAHALLDGSRS